MNLSLIEARLKAQLTGLHQVGVAADLDAAMEGAVTTPSAFVLPLRDRGIDMPVISITQQKLDQVFGVVLCLQNLRDTTGKAALGDLATQRQALKTALIGWVPDAANGEPVTFTEGRLLRMENARLWWIDQFAISTYWSS